MVPYGMAVPKHRSIYEGKLEILSLPEERFDVRGLEEEKSLAKSRAWYARLSRTLLR